MELNQKQTDTILAALRLYQQAHNEAAGDLPSSILDIADNGRDGDESRLTMEEVDELCERLNAPTQAKFVVITDLLDTGANAYVGSFKSEEEVREWVGQFYPELSEGEEPDVGDMIGYTIVPLDEFLGDSVMELCLF